MDPRLDVAEGIDGHATDPTGTPVRTPIPANMAEAHHARHAVTPKQLGKHLREVRRRKGLSLSEVARGAGLTRRELNAYEKGKIPIPDSDLFVLAGSCGVDVAELRVPTTAAELGAAHGRHLRWFPPTVLTGPSTIGDVVAQLRRSQEVAPLTVPNRGDASARALGSTAPRRQIGTRRLARTGGHRPGRRPLARRRVDPLTVGVRCPAPAEPVDMFQELARLPEPEQLSADEGRPRLLRTAARPLTSPPAMTDLNVRRRRSATGLLSTKTTRPVRGRTRPRRNAPRHAPGSPGRGQRSADQRRDARRVLRRLLRSDDVLPVISWRPQLDGSLGPAVEASVRPSNRPRSRR